MPLATPLPWAIAGALREVEEVLDLTIIVNDTKLPRRLWRTMTGSRTTITSIIITTINHHTRLLLLLPILGM